MFILKKIKRSQIKRLWPEWQKQAKEYPRLLKAAQQENPPGINSLWVCFLQAVILNDRSYLDEAVKLKFIIEDTSRVDALIGVAYAKLGVEEQAICRLRRVVEKEKNNIEYKKYLAIALTLPKESTFRTEQIRLSLEVLKEQPKEWGSYFLLAEIMCEYDRFHEMEKYIQNAYKVAPNGPWGWRLWGQAKFALGDFDRALISFRKAVSFEVKNDYNWAMIALCLYLLGKPMRAKFALRKALKIDSQSKFANQLFDELSGKFARGMESFNYEYKPYHHELLHRESKNKKFTDKRIKLYFAASESLRTNNVQPITTAASELNGALDKAFLQSVVGRVKYILGHEQEGIQEMLNVCREKESLFTMSNYLHALGEKGETDPTAIAMTHRLAELLQATDLKGDDHPWALWSLVICKETAAMLLPLYLRACETLEENFAHYGNVGQCLYHLGRYEEALEYYRKCRKIFEGNPCNLSMDMAKCYLAMNKKEDALKHIEDALLENPESHKAQEMYNRCQIDISCSMA